jgi:NADH dehydrogenase
VSANANRRGPARAARWQPLVLAGLGAAAGLALYRRRRASPRWMRLAQQRALGSDGQVPRRRAVVLGAGFAGLSCAIELARRCAAEPDTEVLLVDRHNYHLFTPLLYHAATGLVEPSHITYPVRAIARRYGFAFRESLVQSIDLARRQVLTDDGPIAYDALVVALGSRTNFFGLASVAQHTLRLKEVADAVAIRNRIIDAFERAELETDPARRRALLTFLVVGAGATGVELVGAIHGYIFSALLDEYPGVRPHEIRIVLAEAAPEILRGVDRALAAHALREFSARGIEVRTNTPVQRVTPEGAELGAGEWLPCATVIWTAGIEPVELVRGLPVEHARDGRVRVQRDLTLPGHPDVYVVGDAAHCQLAPDAPPLPPNAPVAIEQGRHAARNIWRRWQGQPPLPFHYRAKGELISLGRHKAVAEIYGLKLQGLPAWVVWRAYYLSRLVGFKNRLAVALDWSFAYFWRRDTARLEPQPATWEGSVPHEAACTAHE